MKKIKNRAAKGYCVFRILFLLTLIHACAKPCDPKGLKALKAAEEGDLQGVKDYLENGGDPLYTCGESRSGSGLDYVENRLSDYIIISESYEMVEYYLTYNIPAEVKDEMLETTTGDKRRNNITKLLLTHGAHINGDARSCCTKACIPTLENLHSLNYDFNWIDPETGNNLFMEYAGCPAPDGADDLIKTMQYLIELGSKTDLKNKEGKTAYDLAVNKEVKAFLKTL